MPRRLIILDANASWVRSLFLAMPADVEFYFFRVYQFQQYGTSAERPWFDALRWRKTGPRIWQQTVPIPGWSRFSGLSTAIVVGLCRLLISRIGSPWAIVYTLPQYAGVAAWLSHHRGVYDAHDTFRHYDWDRQKTIALERQMLSHVRIAFAVARLVQDDLQADAREVGVSTPVEYLPMAASRSFVEAMGRHSHPRPGDLPPGKVVGCTGQINRSYDWALIAAVADALPDVSLVFIGPLIEPDPSERARIMHVLKKPNVHWLGKRPHEQLPAYLAHFDVCLNPLAVTAHNDRRSPLRLFDYLATDRPVLSTAIAEAFEHLPHLDIGRDEAECVSAIRAMLAGDRPVDLASRHRYMLANTWEARARAMVDRITQIAGGGPTA